MYNNIKDFSWVGSQENFVDRENTQYVNHIIVGRYGGNSNAGQYKNEDGCLVWLNENEDWEFVIILDAHNTAESAEKIVELFEEEKFQIKKILSMKISQNTFKTLEEKILSMFQSREFLNTCRNVQGETACLIVVRKDKYMWWFSVGDCVLYLFHPELSALGQYQINQRQFYEWIGQVNTFEQAVPCYSVGIRELRQGENRILLTTDGLIECPNEPYSNPKSIYDSFVISKEEESIKTLFQTIQENNVRDSTTIISWKVTILKEVTLPSNL
ncbi:protein phosphatase 2C domain-containing protein [Solibacillus sp. MA9]|uniref:Protein phosphatase 2C domain-containing protein n=1 Tax=Solibacillus palustris TaxID=2908203 RepID=A0ABS9UGE7_9BACL|nr:protein phosphatase 2C domain-containing protein [Solibacillus sp. MA9]MCH7323433.1 protein phosphatase 2C domain-containing protein [Solibacillus sp. MA9]